MSVKKASPLQEFVWRITTDVKILSLAGSVLFFLGLAGALLAQFVAQEGEKPLLYAQSALLLALGTPLLYHVQSLSRFAALQRRIEALERPDESTESIDGDVRG